MKQNIQTKSDCTGNGYHFGSWKLYRHQQSSGTCFTKRRWFDLLYNLSQDDFKLGGSSLAQTLNTIGKDAPTIKDAAFQKKPSIRCKN
jgi:hypothetical protein